MQALTHSLWIHTMNRCYTTVHFAPTRRSLLRRSLATTLLAWAGLASAQSLERAFPADAERGVMQVIAPPVIHMSGRPERLSPGARIRGANNMLQMSGALIGQNLVVNFVRNPLGEVHEVWLLTEAEAASTLPTQR
jgi:hypothetical protein